MNLADKQNVTAVLKKAGFSFKKSLGQNFLVDDSVCPRMAAAVSGKENGVLEIGPGAGVLTRELSAVAKRVVAVEIDERLRPVLDETLKGADNTKVIFGDVLKLDLKRIIAEEFADCQNVSICANLPYYITSPVIMGLLESKLPINSIVVMVQKEAADRLCATVGTREAGAVTAAVSYYADAKELFFVPCECFLPAPKVDSAVIELKIRENPPIKINDEGFFFRMVKACFAQRRKTLQNTLSNTMGINKADIKAALSDLGLDESVRGEALNMQQLAFLSDRLKPAD